jgi:hypothetical protein
MSLSFSHSHGIEVLSGFHLKLLWWVLDMFLAVDTNEVPSHGKRNGNWIGSDFVAGEKNDSLGQTAQADLFQQQRDHLGIGFCLMVGEEDDIVILVVIRGRSEFFDSSDVLFSEDSALFFDDQRTKKFIAPLIIVERTPNRLMERLELIRRLDVLENFFKENHQIGRELFRALFGLKTRPR